MVAAACRGLHRRELAFAAIVSDSEFLSCRRWYAGSSARRVAGLIRALGREVDDLDVALGDVCVVLRRVADNRPRHRCVDCGFTSRALLRVSGM
jgi:hypothetical protein